MTSNFLGFDFDFQRSFYWAIRKLVQYLTSYPSSIDIFPPYRTVLKIFDFKGLTLTINL